MSRCSPYLKQSKFTIRAIQKIPDDAIGIYGFWYNKRCIYVGQAALQPIKKRLLQHWSDCKNENLRKWIQAKGREIDFAYCDVENPGHINYLENYYIKTFAPMTNIIQNIAL